MTTAKTPRVVELPQSSSEFLDVIKLNRLAGMLSRPFFQRFAGKYEITLNEWRALVLIVRSPEIASQDIAEFTGMHAMNVSRAVAGLRGKGRVTSHQDPENHRRQLLTATDAGVALIDELLPSAEWQAGRVLSVLTPAERAAFSGMLDRLIEQAEIVLLDDERTDDGTEDGAAGNSADGDVGAIARDAADTGSDD